MGTSQRLLTLLRRRGGSWIESNALLYDTFKTDDAAPITSPRTAEPGPGLLVVTDTENKLSLSGGDLVCAGGKSSPGYGDPGVWLARDNAGSPATQDIFSGYAAFFDVKNVGGSGLSSFGFDTNSSSIVSEPRFILSDTTLICDTLAADETPSTWSAGSTKRLLLITRSDTNGVFFVCDGVLLNVNEDPIIDPAYVSISNRAASFTAAYIALLPLADYNPAWGGDWSGVTDTDATPTATESVDRAAGSCLIEFGDITLPSDAMAVQVRRVDATNYTTLDIAADGSATIKETIAGAEGAALVSIGASGISDASDLKVLDSAGTVKVFSAGVLAGTATLTDHAEAVLVYVEDLGTGGALSEVTTHPYPELGIATSRVVCPQAADTATHSADFVTEIKDVTLPSSSLDAVSYRYTNDNNRLYIRFDDDGAVKFYDVASGSYNLKISGAAGTVSNGDDVVLVCDGASAEIFVNGSSIGTGTIVANLTGTSMKVSTIGAGGSIGEINNFPRDVSSLLPKGCF